MMAILRKFWCLEGFVAIIFTIFCVSALLNGSYLSGMLMGIFSYWWIKRVLAKPYRPSRRNCQTDWHGSKDLQL